MARARKQPKPQYKKRHWNEEEPEQLPKAKSRDKRSRRARSSWLARSGLVSLIITLLIFGLILHGLFSVFDIYDRNRAMGGTEHAETVLKLLIFFAITLVMFQITTRLRPLSKRVRGVAAKGLIPAVAVAAFNLYGGSVLFNDNPIIIMALNIIIGIGGFIGYVMVYSWIIGNRGDRSDPLAARKKSRPKRPGAAGKTGRPPPVVKLPD